MADQTTIVDASDLLNDFSSMDNFLVLKNGEEEYWHWPNETGKGFFYVIKLRPGLLLSIVNYQLKHPISVYISALQSCCEISFPLLQNFTCNEFNWQGEDNNFNIETEGGYLSFISNWHGIVNCPAGNSIIYMGIYIDPEILISFIKDSDLNLPNDSKDFVKQAIKNQYYIPLSITPVINMKLYEMLSCSYKGGLKRIFLESRTLDLIVLSLSQLSNIKENAKSSFLIKENDFDIIRNIRNLLFENTKKPLSLDQLSKIAGMNKNKLNHSFREVYGSSIFEYLRTCRLERAKQLLMNGKMNVTEAAFEVGYAQQSNFTKEFKKKYGKSPKNFVLNH